MTRDAAITALVGEMHHEIFRVGDHPALGVPVEQVQRWADTLSALGGRPGHDQQCESELTSHGYTPCQCSERAGICYCRKNPCECLPHGALGGRPETGCNHDFKDYVVCCKCGQTAAATGDCHHCTEPDSKRNGRCWWCLRPLPSPPLREQP